MKDQYQRQKEVDDNVEVKVGWRLFGGKTIHPWQKLYDELDKQISSGEITYTDAYDIRYSLQPSQDGGLCRKEGSNQNKIKDIKKYIENYKLRNYLNEVLEDELNTQLNASLELNNLQVSYCWKEIQGEAQNKKIIENIVNGKVDGKKRSDSIYRDAENKVRNYVREAVNRVKSNKFDYKNKK